MRFGLHPPRGPRVLGLGVASLSVKWPRGEGGGRRKNGKHEKTPHKGTFQNYVIR